MILEFRCSNYKSIDDEVTLSMMATKAKEHSENLLYYKNKGVLPVVSIYGANGAGKTNILNAIGYLNFMVSNSNSFKPGEKISFFPHKLSNKDKSEFSIQLNINGTRYAYGFSNNEECILEEYLYHFKNNRQAKIFERVNETYSFGSDYKNYLNEVKNKNSRKNKLFLSVAALNINIKEIIEVFIYISYDLVVKTSINNEKWKNKSLLLLKESDTYKEHFLNILKSFDINIKDINIESTKVKINYEELPQNIPEDLKMTLSKKEGEIIDVKINYGDLEVSLNEESRGINKLFEILVPLIDILKKGKTLIYDELETSMHPVIVKNIIKLFNDKTLNKNNAQLIFTTHDINLLDIETFRRDQIWFSEKYNKNMSTILYSLVELKNIRSDENLESGYIRGKYGSIPFIDSDSIKKVFI